MYVSMHVGTCVCARACAYLHGGSGLPFAKFVNLMLEDAFNFERSRILFKNPEFELNIQPRQVLHRL
jgi:hypothetical protein